MAHGNDAYFKKVYPDAASSKFLKLYKTSMISMSYESDKAIQYIIPQEGGFHPDT